MNSKKSLILNWTLVGIGLIVAVLGMIYDNDGLLVVGLIAAVVNGYLVYTNIQTMNALKELTKNLNETNRAKIVTQHPYIKGTFDIVKINGLKVNTIEDELPAGEYTLDLEYGYRNVLLTDMKVTLLPQQMVTVILVEQEGKYSIDTEYKKLK